MDETHERLALDVSAESFPEDARPHPKVGAVAVRDDKVLATAFRGEFAQGDHAEYTLLERKLPDVDLTGATLYTTLEPCTTRQHPKMPCAERIVHRRIGRVVIGIADPNPTVQGRGIYILKSARIKVDSFIPELEERARQMNTEFLSQTFSGAETFSTNQVTALAVQHCRGCKGTGREATLGGWGVTRPHPACEGSGWVRVRPGPPETKKCGYCKGTGKIVTLEGWGVSTACIVCDGTGFWTI